jgi:two-component system alkaline phosphatase synthesis response regulator PhoP
MATRVLLIEDEPGLVLTLSDLLAAEGYEVDSAPDGPSGLEKALAGRFEIIVLDVMLPGKSGFEVCKDIRQHGVDSAVLMLTARTQVVDKVVGLKLGADDYLTKPFDPAELVARIEALQRRVFKDKLSPVSRFKFGDVEVDFDRGEVTKAASPVALAGKELQLLRYMVDHRGKALSREDLLQQVWEYQPTVTSRTVDVHVAWLRQKLEDNPQMPRHFHTVRGVGYRFTP